jgi:Arc/MetJ-type ribon-helix-helix transcriptional regulator
MLGSCEESVIMVQNVYETVEDFMNIRLIPHSEELIKAQLAQGPYHSPEEVIERALEELSKRVNKHTPVDLAHFEATLDALAEGSERIPVLPSEATSRSSIYRDHS